MQIDCERTRHRYYKIGMQSCFFLLQIVAGSFSIGARCEKWQLVCARRSHAADRGLCRGEQLIGGSVEGNSAWPQRILTQPGDVLVRAIGNIMQGSFVVMVAVLVVKCVWGSARYQSLFPTAFECFIEVKILGWNHIHPNPCWVICWMEIYWISLSKWFYIFALHLSTSKKRTLNPKK